MKVNVIVLNYNGKGLLKECLPSILTAASNCKYGIVVTVLDNQSTDDSEVFISENFPNVKFVKAPENKVYSSYNYIAPLIDEEIIVVMNSDIKVEPDYFDHLIEPFERIQNLLFVAAKGYNFDGTKYEGDRSIPGFHWGIIEPKVRYNGYEELIEKSGYAFSTGVGAFDRKKFLELEGYDEIYIPGRYEDVDLCYRGWKKGYIGLYAPKAVHYHKGGASFKNNYKEKQIAEIVFRNSIIFMLKNVTNYFILFKFACLTFFRVLYYVFAGKFFFLRGFKNVFILLPKIIQKRNHVNGKFFYSDKEIFMMFKRKD